MTAASYASGEKHEKPVIDYQRNRTQLNVFVLAERSLQLWTACLTKEAVVANCKADMIIFADKIDPGFHQFFFEPELLLKIKV